MANRPELISEVVKEVIENLKIRGKGREGAEGLVEAWRKIVGPKMAKQANPVSIKGDKLIVSVSSPSWSYQLNLQKEKILEKLKKRLKNHTLKDMQFRVS